jgi:plasmid maintenance system antidote protein VapI
VVSQFEKYKGIHPGIILDRELKKRFIKQRPFALTIGEHPQSFNAITKGKRGLSTALALKIEKELELPEGTFVFLQAYYEIQKIKDKDLKNTPNLNLLRTALFWDTEIQKIDWNRQIKSVIERVYERGNESEKSEINRFYGINKVQKVLNEVDARKSYSIKTSVNPEK